MTITVKFFAILRDTTGTSEATLQLADEMSVQQALDEIGHRWPAVLPMLPRIAAAVNLVYAEKQRLLHDGDELALLPPVSGGCS